MFKSVAIAVLFFAVTIVAQPPLGLKFTPAEQLQGIPLASTPFSGQELPALVDLSPRMPPIGNQGKQSSCVGWAVAYANKSFQERIEENSSYTIPTGLNREAIFSPAFIYNQINNGVDGGSFFTDALNLVSQKGAVKWIDMPYLENDFTSKPNQTLFVKAKKYRIDFWRRVNVQDQKEIKAQLNAGYPVIIGAMVDDGFLNGRRTSAGVDYVWSARSGQERGGHAMLIVGYDDLKGAFKLLNSWGLEWGNDGYAWISYEVLPRVVREGYVMKDAVNSADETPRPPPVVDPSGDLRANFKILSVNHNVPNPQFGPLMRFDGMVELPQGVGRSVQMVIRFYLNDGRGGKGAPVGSLLRDFSMPDGTAACGTPKIPYQSGNQTWFAFIPYLSLNIPRGGPFQLRTTHLVAEPALYIDDFALKTGDLIPFFVNL